MTGTMKVWATQARCPFVRKAGGWAFLVLGAAGLVLPVMPGIPLVAAGLIMLSSDYPWARTLLRRTRKWIRKINLYRSRKMTAGTRPESSSQ